MNAPAAASPGTIDVQAFIDNRRFSPYQWLILVLCFLIVATDDRTWLRRCPRSSRRPR
jgi:AAHS family 4-hydroxybenzoate transporter-like MFS transporter